MDEHQRSSEKRRLALSALLLGAGIALVLMALFGVGAASAHDRYGPDDGSGRDVVPAAGVVPSTASGDRFTIKSRGHATETAFLMDDTTPLERGVSSRTISSVETGIWLSRSCTGSGSPATACRA